MIVCEMDIIIGCSVIFSEPNAFSDELGLGENFVFPFLHSWELIENTYVSE